MATALAAGLGAATSAARAQERLDQGWSEREREWWYSVSQGSRLVPEAWLRALEQAGSTQPFLAPDHIRRLRYIPRDESAAGRALLPVGFAVDAQSDQALFRTKLRWFDGQGSQEPWVGFNCAACHTAEITYRGRRLRIEGGPTLADFQGFREALVKALRETRSDPAKLGRFGARVLDGRDTGRNREQLAAALTQLLHWEEALEVQNGTASATASVASTPSGRS